MNLFDDPCANRHGGSPTSEAAHDKIEPYKSDTHRRILQRVRMSGERGMTVKELCYAMDTTPNCISGRLTELKTSGMLKPNGQRRDGCVVLVLGATS